MWEIDCLLKMQEHSSSFFPMLKKRLFNLDYPLTFINYSNQKIDSFHVRLKPIFF